MLTIAPPTARPRECQAGPAAVEGPSDARGPAARTLHVVAATADPAAVAFYQAALPRLGHRVQVVRTGPDLVAACRLLGPDLVLCAPDLPGLDGLAAAEAACRERPVPVVVVAPAYELAVTARAAAGEWVMACLPWRVGEAALGAALAVAAGQFDRLRALGAEVADLKQALEDRKAVERAKGAVGRRTGLPEDEAYRRLRALASNANRKLADVAKDVLAAEQTFGELESVESRACGRPRSAA
jgi:response regulator NasT